MESRIEPYSLQLYPTCKKFFQTMLDADRQQYPFLFKHTSTSNLLDRIQATVEQFFTLDKIDCGADDWVQSYSRVLNYFSLESNHKTNVLNVYMLLKFKTYAKKQYACCCESLEKRFCKYEKSESEKQKAHTWQIFLNALIHEAKALQEVGLGLEQLGERVKAFILFKKLPISEKEKLPYFQISPKNYKDAKKLFRSYPPILFKDPNQVVVCFKTIKTRDVNHYRKILDKIKIKEKFEEIGKLAFAHLNEASNDFFKFNKLEKGEEFHRDIIPFYYQLELVDEKIQVENDKNVWGMFVKINEIYDLWKEFKKYQEEFFDYGIKELSALVKQNHDLISYTSGIQCYPGSQNQSDYSKHFKSLLKKEKKIKNKPSKTVRVMQMAYHAVTRNNTNDEIVKTMQKQITTIPVQKALENGNPFPGEPFQYQKLPRVTRWETEGTLLAENFLDYDPVMFQDLQWWLKLIHNPHPFIDNFLSLGFEHQFYSEERQEFQPCISILTEIHFMDAIYRGLMQYTFDKNKQYLYHKCFKNDVEDTLIKEKLRVMEYPVLSTQVKKMQYGKTSVSTDDLGNVTLKDRDVTVKLFK